MGAGRSTGDAAEAAAPHEPELSGAPGATEGDGTDQAVDANAVEQEDAVRTGATAVGSGTADAVDDSDRTETDRTETDRTDSDPTGTDERLVTPSTARPEGGGRAAGVDAPAPARQWPLLSVLVTAALGLVIVGLHPFSEAFRIGTILIGIALLGGAALRRLVPSVGMLAVRSRFTDMITYAALGIVIVMLSLMTQPRPWLEIPFLEDVVHSTVP
jgi:hypothetical protein